MFHKSIQNSLLNNATRLNKSIDVLIDTSSSSSILFTYGIVIMQLHKWVNAWQKSAIYVWHLWIIYVSSKNFQIF